MATNAKTLVIAAAAGAAAFIGGKLIVGFVKRGIERVRTAEAELTKAAMEAVATAAAMPAAEQQGKPAKKEFKAYVAEDFKGRIRLQAGTPVTGQLRDQAHGASQVLRDITALTTQIFDMQKADKISVEEAHDAMKGLSAASYNFHQAVTRYWMGTAEWEVVEPIITECLVTVNARMETMMHLVALEAEVTVTE